MRLIETRNFRTCSWTTSLSQPWKIARCVARSRWHGDCLGGLRSGASVFHLAALGRVEVCHFEWGQSPFRWALLSAGVLAAGSQHGRPGGHPHALLHHCPFLL